MKRRICIAVGLMALLPSCLSAAVAEWGRKTVSPGHPIGAARTESGGDQVLYEFETDAGPRYRALSLPADWRALPRKTSTSSAGVLVSLEPLIPFEDVAQPSVTPSRVHDLDRALSLGYAVMKPDLGGNPYAALKCPTSFGAVASAQDRGGESHQIHDVFAYDVLEYRWVQVGTIDLGPRRRDRTALACAVVLFLPALALDVTAILVVVLAGLSEDLPQFKH